MNQKLKQAGLFAILAVFTISLTTSFVGDAEAAQQYSSKTGEPVELSIRAQQHAQTVESFKVEASPPSLQQMTIHDPTTRSDRDFTVTGDVKTFTAVYVVVNPANIDLRNVEILVTSDTESVKGELIGKYDENHRTISVMIDAVDPASVNAEIQGFEI